MKLVAIAVLSVFPMSHAFADQPYPHEYLNEDYFAVQDAAVEPAQTEEPYKHVYENGGYFEVGAPELSEPRD